MGAYFDRKESDFVGWLAPVLVPALLLQDTAQAQHTDQTPSGFTKFAMIAGIVLLAIGICFAVRLVVRGVAGAGRAHVETRERKQ